MSAPLLTVRDLSKTYVLRSIGSLLGLRKPKVVQALKDVCFDLQDGEITALLGPNGSGKTTLMNIIADLVRPEAGMIEVQGTHWQRGEVQRKIGLVTTNERSFFWRLTGRQNLEFFAALYELPRRVARTRCQELLDRFGLETAADRLFRTYSLGMKKRLALARSMIHDPRVLLMDEPTSGLDAAGVNDLLVLVRSQFAEAGRGVLWATHRVDEVRTLCDRVVILGNGSVRFMGTTAEFGDLHGRRSSFVIECRPSESARAAFDAALAFASGVTCSRQGALARITVPNDGSGELLAAVMRELFRLGVEIRRVEPGQDSLLEVFAALGTADGSKGGALDGAHDHDIRQSHTGLRPA